MDRAEVRELLDAVAAGRLSADDAESRFRTLPLQGFDDLPRQAGDRPQVVPDGWANLAFIGQFCELPNDVVFTVEYSIRSAQTAVYTLLGLNRAAPAVYKGQHDPRVVYGAASELRHH